MKQSFGIFHFWKFLLFPSVITFGPLETLKGPGSKDNKRPDVVGAVLGPASLKIDGKIYVPCDVPDQAICRKS